MKLQHLIELINELKPNTYFKYIRSDEKCEYIKIDMNEPRVYSKTPDGKDHSIADTYLQLLAVGHGIINTAIQSVYYKRPMNQIEKMANAEVRVLIL